MNREFGRPRENPVLHVTYKNLSLNAKVKLLKPEILYLTVHNSVIIVIIC